MLFRSLGDVVVSLIVSRELFLLFKDVPEGNLTRMRSQIVCEKSFSEAAIDLNLGKYLLLSKGEKNTGGRTRESILADTFEVCRRRFYNSGRNDWNFLCKKCRKYSQVRLNRNFMKISVIFQLK